MSSISSSTSKNSSVMVERQRMLLAGSVRSDYAVVRLPIRRNQRKLDNESLIDLGRTFSTKGEGADAVIFGTCLYVEQQPPQ